MPCLPDLLARRRFAHAGGIDKQALDIEGSGFDEHERGPVSMLVDQSMIDVGTADAVRLAREAESIGFDGVWATESVTDSTLMAMGAALNTDRVHIGTAVTIAFARNPMSLAYSAWDLASASNGRFTLGLGSQVRAHVERRYSMPWSNPVSRMRDYVGALRAIWSSWQSGAKLDFRSEHYNHSLMTPVFTPHHHEHPLRVMLSAVGPKMTGLAAEVCDGVILHGFTTPRYLDTVTLPALAAGLERAGRAREDFVVYCPLFLITGDTDEEMEAMREQTRDQIAFYASTPNYRDVLVSMGCEDLQTELQALSRAGRWKEMTALLPDEVLDGVAITGKPEELPDLIRARFAGRLDRISSRFGWPLTDEERIRDIVDRLHDDTPRA
jgi:probable F420-dependent oxidoreductase